MTSTATGPVQHYSAEDAPRGYFAHVGKIVGFPRTLIENRWLIQNFFRRELLGRFRGSALGMFWVLVQPIFLFIVYYLVFGLLFGNWKAGQAPDPNFALYLFSGILFFNVVMEGTTRSLGVVLENANLVKKVAFPSEVLPVHCVLTAQVVYLVGVVICLVAGMAFGVLQPGIALLGLPLVLLVQFVLVLGIGFTLATFQVFARDTNHLWGIVSMAWLFLSPVFWFPHFLEAKFEGFTRILEIINPVHALMQAQRIALGAVNVQTDGVVDDPTTTMREGYVDFGEFWPQLGIGACWATLCILLGYGIFVSRKHKFADQV